jgi:hypothetical protein
MQLAVVDVTRPASVILSLPKIQLVVDLWFAGRQAACRYSLVRPLRTGFPADSRSVEVSHGGRGSVVSGIGNTLVRPGSVVVHLVLG